MDYRSDDLGNWRKMYVVSYVCGEETTCDRPFWKNAVKPLDCRPKLILCGIARFQFL